jgi:hypothetical protein
MAELIMATPAIVIKATAASSHMSKLRQMRGDDCITDLPQFASASPRGSKGDVSHQALLVAIASEGYVDGAGIDLDMARYGGDEIVLERVEFSWREPGAIVDQHKLQALAGRLSSASIAAKEPIT